MIHAYNEQWLGVIQPKVAFMFEFAVLKEALDIDDFADKFAKSEVARSLETADCILALGKSSIELLYLVLGKEPHNIEATDIPTPEFWVGWVLAYAQWHFNRTYADLIKAIKPSHLLNYYFPYHEMDIRQTMDLIAEYLQPICPLKKIREKQGYSQSQLANISGIPLRSIRAYEQGSVDIAKAQAETLYLLSECLGCAIEDLIK